MSGAVLPRHEEELPGSGHQTMRAQHGARLRARVQPLHGGSALGLDDREGPGFKPPEITEIKLFTVKPPFNGHCEVLKYRSRSM